MEELQDRVAEEWEATPIEYLAELARSMPERCQAVIDAKGQHTNTLPQKSLGLRNSRMLY
jgi:hypothetical protein